MNAKQEYNNICLATDSKFDKESRPFWSVMIPTFNCAHYLGQTLESVLAQDPGVDQMQVEVVDDCSSLDDPESVVKTVGKGRVSFYRQPYNVGATNNFNTCIDRSKGEFVHILHGDDLVEPSFYETVRELIDAYTNASLYAARFYYMEENGVRTGISPRLLKYENAVCHESSLFSEGPVIHFVTSVFRRNFLQQYGGFNPSLIHAADWEMWVRLIREGGIVMTPKVLGSYRVFDNNDTGRLMKSAENLIDRQRCIELLVARYPDFDVERAYISTLTMCEKQEKRFKEIGDIASASNNRIFWNNNTTLTAKLGRMIREITDSIRSNDMLKKLLIK